MAPSEATTDTFDSIVLTLLSAIEAKDLNLRRHSERVAKYAVQIAELYGLDADACEQIHYGGLLHDIGNIGIPDSILLKPSGLSQWEFEEMKLHPIIGEQICKALVSVEPLRPIIRSHHEKMDGSGYPDGLRGERAYRSAFVHEEALKILQEESARGWWKAETVELLADLNVSDADYAPV